MNELTFKALTLFKLFMIRQNDVDMPKEKVLAEIKLMMLAKIDATVSFQERETKFLSYRRIGSTNRVNRKIRKNWLLTWENAVHHAMFESK